MGWSDVLWEKQEWLCCCGSKNLLFCVFVCLVGNRLLRRGRTDREYLCVCRRGGVNKIWRLGKAMIIGEGLVEGSGY